MRKGWEIKKLGELCKYDKTPNRKAELPYVGLEHIESQTGKFIGTFEVQKVKSSTFYFSDKHVLYGRLRPYLNKVLLPSFEGHCSTEIFPILVNKELERKFLFYWLISENTVEKINATWTGARMPRANMNSVLNFDFFYPSIKEQQRIVSILDEAFEAIDQAKANTEKNLQNAKELLQSELNSIFTNKSEGWVERRFGDLCSRVSVGHVGPTSEFYCDSSVGIPFLRSQNVRSGKLDWTGVQYITKEFHQKLKKSQLKFEDILFVRVGANRGDCCIIKEKISELNCANIVFARLKEGNVDFIDRFCQSPIGREQLLGMSVGSAQGVINTKSVAEFLIPYPNNLEQNTIVKQLDTLSSETKQLEENYRKKLESLEELKKSILQKAFSGELTNKKYKITEQEQLDMVAEG